MSGHRFLAAPHRLFFAWGAIELILPMAIWFAVLAGRVGGASEGMVAVLPMRAHAISILLGPFLFFVLGFLLTVYPRWMNQPALAPGRFIPAFGMMVTGRMALVTGLLFDARLAAIGAFLLLLGWGTASASLLSVWYVARGRGIHERSANLALTVASLGIAVIAAGLWIGDDRFLATGQRLLLFGWIVPLAFTVAHRMIPFFGSTALADYPLGSGGKNPPAAPGGALRAAPPSGPRSAWGVQAVWGCMAGALIADMAGRPALRLPFDLGVAAIAGWHSRRWHRRDVYSVPLLAMLHVAFHWLWIAFLLQALADVGAATGHPSLVPPWAALHALTIGFMAGIVLAMATRVTLGHSGLPLTADRYTYRLFLALSGITVLRVAVEWLPLDAGFHDAGNLVVAGLWLTVMAFWAIRYVPPLLRPRADGRPG